MSDEATENGTDTQRNGIGFSEVGGTIVGGGVGLAAATVAGKRLFLKGLERDAGNFTKLTKVAEETLTKGQGFGAYDRASKAFEQAVINEAPFVQRAKDATALLNNSKWYNKTKDLYNASGQGFTKTKLGLFAIPIVTAVAIGALIRHQRNKKFAKQIEAERTMEHSPNAQERS